MEASSSSAEELKVFDPYGTSVTLAETIKQGGEGSIYAVTGKRGTLVKIYHADTIDTHDKWERMSKRIPDMVNMPSLTKNPSLAWPMLAFFDAPLDHGGKLIGFAMRRLPGREIRGLHFGDGACLEQHFPDWNRRHLALVALDFVEKLQCLHAQNVLVNDFNPGNFIVDAAKAKVGFIDCDSYQVSVPGKNRCHPSGAHFPTHCAPELLANKSLLATPRLVEHDLFGAAVVIFQTLMLGLHPYAHINGEDPESNLRSGRCPLGMGANCHFPAGPWFNRWSWLSHRLKKLFIQTFQDGHRELAKRARLQEWEDGLRAYINDMDKRWLITDLTPAAPKPHDYKGKRSVN